MGAPSRGQCTDAAQNGLLHAGPSLAAAALPPAPWETACAGESNGETRVSLTVDNDFFAGYDRHYTNGIQLAFSPDGTALSEAIRSLPPLRWSAEPRFTFAIGQRIYTPNDKTRTVPDPLDRPYGGWLYALADVRTKTGHEVDSVQASLGVIGPASFAEQTQNGYHSLIGAQRANGWDTQIDNKLALLFGYRHSSYRTDERQGGRPGARHYAQGGRNGRQRVHVREYRGRAAAWTEPSGRFFGDQHFPRPAAGRLPPEREYALWLVRLNRHRRAPRRLERISRQPPRCRRPRRQTQKLICQQTCSSAARSCRARRTSASPLSGAARNSKPRRSRTASGRSALRSWF